MLVWFGTTNLVGLGYLLAIPGKVARPGPRGGSLPPADLMIVSALYNAATLILVPLTLAATAGARRRDFGLTGPGLGRPGGPRDPRLPAPGPLRLRDDAPVAS